MWVLSTLAALGASNLPAPEHTLLLAQPQFRELNSGTLGPVANEATKILVTYRHQRPHLQIPQPLPDTRLRHTRRTV